MDMSDTDLSKIFDKRICPALVDYDQTFLNDPDAKVIPCGDALSVSVSQTKDTIATMFQDGTRDLNFVASCSCGELMGNFYEGVVCKHCHTPVKTNFASEIKFRAWLEIPQMCSDPNDPRFIPPVLHPALYIILSKWLGQRNHVNVLDALLNPEIDLPDDLAKAGIGQGYRYFYRNFDDIMHYFLDVDPYMKSAQRRDRADGIRELITAYRPIVFFRHIPVLNQSLHLLTTSGTMHYSDKCSGAILKTRVNLSNMIYRYNNGSISNTFIDTQMWSLYESFIQYVKLISDIKLLGKKGYIRKLILGARLHCSARAVITPISGEHSCDELYIPWRIGVGILKLEILNLLMNRYGYTMPQALSKHFYATMTYDKDVDMIMQTLIRECSEKTNVYVPHLAMSIHPKGLPVLNIAS